MTVTDRRPGLLALGLMKLVQAYQVTLSPFLGTHCRFAPTCSAYALDALRVHVLPQALGLIVWRILRCNPFCRGGLDPVPPRRQDA